MSYHVYIAYERFQDTPILLDAWLEAARNCAELKLTERTNKQGVTGQVYTLKDNEGESLKLRNGMIEARDPAKDLIIVMLKLAEALDAGVYSEKFNRYKTVEEWEERTVNYRKSRTESRAKKATLLKVKRFIMFGLLAILLVVLVLHLLKGQVRI